MEKVGRMLREAREARGLTIEDVARTTRVTRSALLAIEDGDSSQLPAAVYVRGFVRAYALEVGLDPTEVVRELARCEALAAAPSFDSSPALGQPLHGDGGPLGSSDRYALLLGDGPSERTPLRSSHVVLMLLALGMVLAGWVMVGAKSEAVPSAEAPDPPAIQEQVDAVTTLTGTDAGR